MSSHFDILQYLSSQITSLGITMSIQSDLDAVYMLDTYRAALIDCRNFASTVTPVANTDYIPIPTCMASIYHGNTLITSKEKEYIRNILPTNDIHLYYQKKYSWTPAILSDIDWISREKASRKLRKWKFVTQLSCGWLPTNARLHLIEGILPDCPLCGTIETVDHLFCCPGRKTFHSSFCQQLESKLQELRTPPHITQLICDSLALAHNTSPSCTLQHHSQTSIGWSMFRRGFISKQFIPDTPPHWNTRMAIFLLSSTYDLWKSRCHDNNILRSERESDHVKHRMRAKVEELYQLAAQLPRTLQHQFTPEPIEDFLKSHLRHSILTWYAMTKPALQACIRRTKIRHDNSRLAPNHPSNYRIPPDSTIPSPLPHPVLQV
jgi:hypothetical protein